MPELAAPPLANQEILAALDLGSNSFHMVVARLVEGALQPLYRQKDRVQLAAGLNEYNQLNDAAIQRGINSLRSFNEQLQHYERPKVRVVATHTLRAASNADVFLQQAAHFFSHPIEIISGHEEARLVFQGVAHTEHLQGNTLVIDIGGGSTELALGEGFRMLALHSCRMGCVSYSKRYFNKKWSKKRYNKAVVRASQNLEAIEYRYRKIGWQNVRATSGTAAAISEACSVLGFSQGELTPNAIKQLADYLIRVGEPEQIAIDGINEQRKNVLIGGLAIMQAVMQTLSVELVQPSPAALREGVLYEMDASMRFDDIRLRTCHSLMKRYQVDEAQAERVKATAGVIWQMLAKSWHLPEGSSTLLQFASQLQEVGFNINTTGVHKHSSYVLANSDLPGFNQEDQQLLATLVRQYRKRLDPELMPKHRHYNKETQMRLIQILRLASLLHVNRHPEPLPEFAVKARESQMSIRFAAGYLESQPLLQADLEKEQQWLQAFGYVLKYQ